MLDSEPNHPYVLSPARKLTIFSPMTIGACMRILRRMSVLASYAKDPAVRPPGPDVPSVQAPAVRALNSDAGGYNHLGVAMNGQGASLFLSSVGRCSRTIAGGPGLNDGVMIKYVSILVDVCVSAVC